MKKISKPIMNVPTTATIGAQIIIFEGSTNEVIVGSTNEVTVG